MDSKRHRAALFGILVTLTSILLLTATATGISLLQVTITPTAFVYLPYIEKQSTPTPTPTNTPTPTATPTNTRVPQADLRIIALSGTTEPEYVTIQNFGTGSQDMTGWYLVSVVGPQTFYFPAGYVLMPGATVRIESFNGATSNPPAILFWTSAAVWNNAGDKAELRNASGTLISSACYGSGCP